MKELFRKYKWLKYALLTFAVLFVLKIIKTIKAGAKAAGNNINNTIDASTLASVYPQLSHQQLLQRVQKLREIAKELSEAFWNFSFKLFSQIVIYRVDEDEQAAIDSLNELNYPVEAIMVSEFYRDYNSQWDTSTWFTPQKGLSLESDVNKFLNSSERSRIKFAVLNNLK